MAAANAGNNGLGHNNPDHPIFGTVVPAGLVNLPRTDDNEVRDRLRADMGAIRMNYNNHINSARNASEKLLAYSYAIGIDITNPDPSVEQYVPQLTLVNYGPRNGQQHPGSYYRCLWPMYSAR